ncbi:hypothetical protein BJX61DRAFT_547027 [Aspergillus egyptiacus]|nr:hypothetical protein BJX61DRAFT_547027 [Aspergillus egyptiacus]
MSPPESDSHPFLAAIQRGYQTVADPNNLLSPDQLPVTHMSHAVVRQCEKAPTSPSSQDETAQVQESSGATAAITASGRNPERENSRSPTSLLSKDVSDAQHQEPATASQKCSGSSAAHGSSTSEAPSGNTPANGNTDGGETSRNVHNSQDPPALNILVAENNTVVGAIIQLELERLGHNVCLVNDAIECDKVYSGHLLAYYQPRFYDAVLISMSLPKSDGWKAARLIRDAEAVYNLIRRRKTDHFRVPLLALSETVDERNRDLYIHEGFDGWLTKPLTLSRLKELLESLQSEELRRHSAYTPGMWHRGGWFVSRVPSVPVW